MAAATAMATVSMGAASAGPHEDANAADKSGDYATELNILQAQAASGQPWAQNNLGNLYLYGKGVPKSDATALSWLSKAAAQNDPGGEINLGQMYENGWALDVDLTTAANLYRKAGEQNRASGWSMLKRLCDNHRQLPQALCAGIPAGTVSAPMFDISGHPEIGKRLLLDFAKIAVLIAGLYMFFRARRAARSKTGQTVSSA